MRASNVNIILSRKTISRRIKRGDVFERTTPELFVLCLCFFSNLGRRRPLPANDEIFSRTEQRLINNYRGTVSDFT